MCSRGFLHRLVLDLGLPTLVNLWPEFHDSTVAIIVLRPAWYSLQTARLHTFGRASVSQSLFLRSAHLACLHG